VSGATSGLRAQDNAVRRVVVFAAVPSMIMQWAERIEA